MAGVPIVTEKRGGSRMDLTLQICAGASGVVELPSLEEALLRIGFLPVHSLHEFPVSFIRLEDGRVFASVGVRPAVCGELISRMYEQSLTQDVVKARIK